MFFKDLFSRPEDELDHWIDMFGRIVNEHKFQTLGQATKEGTAFRKGIYLTPVVRAHADELHFKLLRCSTTLGESTANKFKLHLIKRKMVQRRISITRIGAL